MKDERNRLPLTSQTCIPNCRGTPSPQTKPQSYHTTPHLPSPSTSIRKAQALH
ncbi:hypothetical protein L873DRAFT_1805026, partial [Choiromyces venosus 120613-1]